jgi:hypothetical protein
MTRVAALVVGCAAAFALRAARQVETGDYLRRSTPDRHRVRLGLLSEEAAPAAGSTRVHESRRDSANGVAVDREADTRRLAGAHLRIERGERRDADHPT